MRAQIREPGQSLRRFFHLLSAICVGVAIYFRVTIGPPLDPVFFMGAALLFMAPFFEQRAKLRDVEIDAQPGHLRVSSRGFFGSKRESVIPLRSVMGASTALVDDRVSLALAIGSRSRHPIVFAFAGEDDLRTVLNALGIGRGGFGILTWDRGPRLIHFFAGALRIVGTLYCFLICLLARISDPFAATLDTTSTSTLLVVTAAAFVLLAPLVIAKRSLSLYAEGVHTFDDRVRFYRYDEIAAIRRENKTISLDLIRRKSPRDDVTIETVQIPFVKRSPFFSFGLDPRDVDLIALQIESAMRRARGEVTFTETRSDLAIVRPRAEETMQSWIDRLDALATSWQAAQRYGDALVHRRALWDAFEDHDGDPSTRGAAARILSKLDPGEAPARIRVVVDAIRSPSDAAKIRNVIEDNRDSPVERKRA